jgi:hypothetical protein
MKKLKNYGVAILLASSLGVMFFACSSESEPLKDFAGASVENNKNSTAKSSSIQSTDCDITGATVINDGNAVVNPGSYDTYTYSYYNNNGSAASVSWRIDSIIPAQSASILADGLSVKVTYNSNFEKAILIAEGIGGTGRRCDSDLKIVKRSGQTGCQTCTPFFANEFYDTSETVPGPVKNGIYFGQRKSCSFNWSSVSSVQIQIGGVYGVGSNASNMPNINTMGQTGGFTDNSNWTTTPSGFRNIKIRTHLDSSNVDPGFLINNTLAGRGGWVTLKFKNNCPDVLLYLNDDDVLSPIF